MKYYKVAITIIDRRTILNNINYDVLEINATNSSALVMIGIRSDLIGAEWIKDRSILLPWHNIRNIDIKEASE